MRWAVYVASTEETINQHRFFFCWKTMGADHLEDLWILNEQNGKVWIGLIFLGIGTCGELL